MIKTWIGRNQTSRLTSVERYWEKVDKGTKEECWPWLGAIHNGGYGTFVAGRKTWQAHRYGWILHHSFDPGIMYVCHVCDNPSCQNPSHLFLGTVRDNNQDRHRKGRSRGAGWRAHNKTKLNPVQVRAIRRLYATGEYTQKQIAAKFGVVHQLVSQIVRGEIWPGV